MFTFMRNKSVFKIISIITCVSLLSGCDSAARWVDDRLYAMHLLTPEYSELETAIMMPVDETTAAYAQLVMNSSVTANQDVDGNGYEDFYDAMVHFDNSQPLSRDNPASVTIQISDEATISLSGTPYIAKTAAYSTESIATRYKVDMLSPIYSLTNPSFEDDVYSAELTIDLDKLGIKQKKWDDVGLFYLNWEDNSVELQEDYVLEGNLLKTKLNHFSDYFVAYKTLTTKDSWKTGVLVLIDDSPSMYSLDYLYENYKKERSYHTKSLSEYCQSSWGCPIEEWAYGDPDGLRWDLMKRIASSEVFNDPEFELVWGVYGSNYEYPEFELGSSSSLISSVDWYASVTDGLRHTGTNIYKGIKDAKSRLLKYDNFDRFVVFSLTDGEQNASSPSADATVSAVNSENVEVHIIGCGTKADSSGLRELAERINVGTYRHISDASSLSFLDDILLSELNEGHKYETKTISVNGIDKQYDLELLASVPYNVEQFSFNLSNFDAYVEGYKPTENEILANGICFGFSEVMKRLLMGDIKEPVFDTGSGLLPLDYMITLSDLDTFNSSKALADFSDVTTAKWWKERELNKNNFYIDTDDALHITELAIMSDWLQCIVTSHIYTLTNECVIVRDNGSVLRSKKVAVPVPDEKKALKIINAYVDRDKNGVELPVGIPQDLTIDELRVLTLFAYCSYLYSSQDNTYNYDKYYLSNWADSRGFSGDIDDFGVYMLSNLWQRGLIGFVNYLVDSAGTFDSATEYEHDALYQAYHELSEGIPVNIGLVYSPNGRSEASLHSVLCYKMYRNKADNNEIIMECYDCNSPFEPLYIISTFAGLTDGQYATDESKIDANNIRTLPKIAFPTTIIMSDKAYNTHLGGTKGTVAWTVFSQAKDMHLFTAE